MSFPNGLKEALLESIAQAEEETRRRAEHGIKYNTPTDEETIAVAEQYGETFQALKWLLDDALETYGDAIRKMSCLVAASPEGLSYHFGRCIRGQLQHTADQFQEDLKKIEEKGSVSNEKVKTKEE